jgi:hypothetical protein
MSIEYGFIKEKHKLVKIKQQNIFEGSHVPRGCIKSDGTTWGRRWIIKWQINPWCEVILVRVFRASCGKWLGFQSKG